MDAPLKALLCSGKAADAVAFARAAASFNRDAGTRRIRLDVSADCEGLYKYAFGGGASYDICFMDYDDGGAVALAKKLAKAGISPPVVFISGRPVAASLSHCARLYDYLFRPVDISAVMTVFTHFYANYKPRKVLLVKNSTHFYIRPENIVSAETSGRGIKIYMSDAAFLEKLMSQHNLRKDINLSERSVRHQQRLFEFKDKLDPSVFVQCHQSFIININKAVLVKRYSALLDNGTYAGLSADISKSRYDEVKNSFIRVNGHQHGVIRAMPDSELGAVAGGGPRNQGETGFKL